MRIGARQTLIFDADDTLWENNVIFERVIADFIDWLAHPTLDGSAIRKILDEIEEANILAHGYGSQVFLRSLADCFTHLTQRPLDDAARSRMAEFTDAFAAGQVQLLPEVTDVLDDLAARHDLFLMTKGEPAEQQRKIDASGLAGHFSGIDIVPAKDPQTYRRIVAERRFDPAGTWMIGNSPKSDIAAARAAGLRAVFIPNPSPWGHEHVDLDPADEGIVRLAGFGELRRLF